MLLEAGWGLSLFGGGWEHGLLDLVGVFVAGWDGMSLGYEDAGRVCAGVDYELGDGSRSQW